MFMRFKDKYDGQVKAGRTRRVIDAIWEASLQVPEYLIEWGSSQELGYGPMV
jgi:hypothetical protein